MEPSILAIILLVIYSIFFLFVKSYVRTYIPLMLVGYLIKVYHIADITSISQLFIYVISFLIAFNMGEKIFFKKISPPTLISNVLEKLIFTFLFFIIFTIVIPQETIPSHFIIFVSVINFIYSSIFVKNSKTEEDFNINNMIIFVFILIFYLIFKESEFTLPAIDSVVFIMVYLITLILFIKLKIESKKQIIGTFIIVVGLSIVVSIMLNIIPLLLGFSFSILLKYLSKLKSTIINNFLDKISQYYIIALLFFSGYMLEISYKFLIVSIIYTAIRILLRIIYYLLSDTLNKSVRNFILGNAPFLVQGEELLIFFAIYSIEFNFKPSLNVILVSLIFSEILINYIHNYTKKTTG